MREDKNKAESFSTKDARALVPVSILEDFHFILSANPSIDAKSTKAMIEAARSMGRFALASWIERNSAQYLMGVAIGFKADSVDTETRTYPIVERGGDGQN